MTPDETRRLLEAAPEHLRLLYAVAMVTGLRAGGATHKEAQELARHTTPGLTANTYARVRNDRLAGITERIAETVLPGETGAHMMHPTEGDVTPQIVKYQPQPALRATEMEWRRGDSNPRHSMFVTFLGASSYGLIALQASTCKFLWLLTSCHGLSGFIASNAPILLPRGRAINY